MKLSTRQTRSTGIAWQQTIPSDWTVVRIKYVLVEKKTRIAPELPCGAISFGAVVYKDGERIPDETRATYQEVLAGEFLVNPINLNYDLKSLRTALAEIDVCVSPAYIVLRLAGDAHKPFLRYLLHEFDVSHMKTLGAGVRQTITFADIGNCYCGLPPFSEQVALAGFLDRETARIDALIEKKTRFIELLREKRQALITQAVTRGVDGNVPMKDSGVDWLGQVPAHWSIKPFKYCVRYQEGPGIMAADFLGEGVPLLRISCVQGRFVSLEGCNFLSPEKVARQWDHFRLEAGDLLISGSASMGVVSEVGEEACGAVAYTGLIRLRGVPDVMERDFIRWLVVSAGFLAQIDLMKAGSTIQHFGPTHLDQMIACRPPIDEQRSIASFLDDQTVRFDDLITTTNRSIGLLRERRAALITAAVIGQIDVRPEVLEEQAEPA